MAFAMVVEVPTLTRHQYKSAAKTINADSTPTGVLYHAAGPIEGGYRFIEVWPNREAADAFYSSERYREAVAGMSGQPEVRLTWEVDAVQDGGGWRPL